MMGARVIVRWVDGIGHWCACLDRHDSCRRREALAVTLTRDSVVFLDLCHDLRIGELVRALDGHDAL